MKDLLAKARQCHLLLLATTLALGGIGVMMLYSAAPNAWQPWAAPHSIRLACGMALVLAIALVDIKIWMKFAYIGYALTLLLLLATRYSPLALQAKGGTRWLDLGLFSLQPSEFMKVALVLALARYINNRTPFSERGLHYAVVPLLLIFVPSAIIFQQPDLGTGVILILTGIAALFAAGVRVLFFTGAGIGGLLSLPIVWRLLQPYQRSRILSFLNPESDPLGSSYHTVQSKIALGSGGLFGKGLFQGTQGHLNFLPEKHTDFIFAMLAEELGFFGAGCLITLYIVLIAVAMGIALSASHTFGRVLIAGLISTIFFYIFINMGMVMNLLPVVGVPLPLVSYGGSAMMTVMISVGLIMNVHIHRNEWLDKS